MKVHFQGERIRVEGEGSYREIRLTRPDRRNALDLKMRDELYESLSAMAVDSTIRGIGLVADGPDFCSGGDLQEFGTTRDPSMSSQIRLMRSLPSLFLRIRDRLVVGIQGAAIGAGLELASFARVVIANPDARFRLPELHMGLIPGCGGTVSIPRRIGAARTLQMILENRWMSATCAVATGLVDELAEGDVLLRRVRQVALS